MYAIAMPVGADWAIVRGFSVVASGLENVPDGGWLVQGHYSGTVYDALLITVPPGATIASDYSAGVTEITNSSGQYATDFEVIAGTTPPPSSRRRPGSSFVF
jgi:hypothetical protein